MKQPKIRIKSKGENSQAAFNILNKNIYVTHTVDTKFSDIKKLFEWLMWLFLSIVIIAVLSSPFIKETGTTLFIFIVYIIGFEGFLISMLCSVFFHFCLKNKSK
ncbi:hypothetical protein EC844_12641 [Acinetobacter calcoaceticus]|uniref:Uncharacterized protein n=1 Tax=Acinetobacter calcoaceticus TaxID=471 RepID=A0A4R1XDJ6_ACICA|nr:hypothetical protein EC844_12641 [Acinetobacter calcoaceticus]